MISEKLRSYRLEFGLSQEQLAEKIGVSRQTISNWENDRRVPDIYSLVSLSDLYGISLDELIKGDVKVMAMLSGKTKAAGEKYLYGATVLNAIGMLELIYLQDLDRFVRVGFMILHFAASLVLMQYYLPYYKEELATLKREKGTKRKSLCFQVFFWFTLYATFSVVLLNFFYL